MNIAMDISPINNTTDIQQRVRGTGFYIENLKSSLLNYFPNNKNIFITRGVKLPKNIDIVYYPYLEPLFLTLSIMPSLYEDFGLCHSYNDSGSV